MDDAATPADDEQFVEFYTRAGCPISASLLRKLRRSGVRLRIHDIWSDDTDAAFVRSVARGCETVPTVVVADVVMVAPGARTVLRAIDEQAPALREHDASDTGRWTSWFRGRNSGKERGDR